jgi:hypothetical protein
LYIFANFRDDNDQIIIFLLWFCRKRFTWVVGWSWACSGCYDNERGDQGDRAESDDELSDEDESDEGEEIAHSVPFKCIGAAHDY